MIRPTPAPSTLEASFSRQKSESALFRLAGANVFLELNPQRDLHIDPLSFEEALLLRDEAIQLALELLTQAARDRGGLSRAIWDFIQANRDGIKRVSEHSRDNTEIISLLDLGWLAMEASLYDLAIFFGLKDPFYRDLCYLQSGRVETFASGRTFKNDGSLRSSLLGIGIDVLCLRLQGDLATAVSTFDSQVIPHFFETQASNLVMRDDHMIGIEDRELGELLLIGATTHFFATSYSTALSLYRAATEILNFADAPSRTAVASFNSAVACNHLQKKREVEQFMAMARNDLRRYSVPGLEASMDLFEIECCAGNAEFSRGLILLEKFFERPDLNPTQRIVGYQTRARIFIELGQLRAADTALSSAKQLIRETGFEQFGGFQAALEIDRETLGGREPQIPTVHARWSLRARNLITLAEIRSLIFRGFGPKAKKLYREFLSAQSRETKSSLFLEDLEAYVSGTGVESDRARTLQAGLFAILEDQRPTHLQGLLSSRKANSDVIASPFYQTLEFIVRSILELERGRATPALEFAAQAQQIANENDLSQLVLLAAAICASLDPHRQFEWSNLLKQTPRTTIDWIERLMSPILPKKVFSSRWMITPSGPEVTYQAVPLESKGLIIDRDAGVVTMDGKVVSFTNQPILLKLLCEIATTAAKGLTKEEAIQRVWDYSYDPLIHDALVYGAIRRLRTQVPIEAFDGRYRIPPGVSWACFVSEVDGTPGPMSPRQRAILDLAANRRDQRVSRQDVVSTLNTSPRTALRELSTLVEMNLFERLGAGRGATYQLVRRR